jgi:large repetitive protein
VEDNEVFDPRTNKWTWLAPMPNPSASAGTVAIGNLIYVIGGNLESGASGIVQVYNTSKDSWDLSHPPMPTARYDFASAEIGNVIYLFGGYGRDVLDVVEAYDTTTRTWRTLSPMSQPRYAFDAVVIDGKIFLFGGRHRGALDSVQVFDPGTQTWSVLNTKIPEGIAGFGAVYADEWVHILKYDLHFAYNPQTNVWRTDLPPMPTSRHGLKADYIDGVIYAVGGCSTGDGNLFDVERNEALPLHPPAYLTSTSNQVANPVWVYPIVLIVAILVWILIRRGLCAIRSPR